MTYTRQGTITYNGVCTVLARPDAILRHDEWASAKEALKKMCGMTGDDDPIDLPGLGSDTLHPGNPGPF
ncbi:hypothetical protein [Ascidiaceihabitans sp.]|uniref:hypothetical protein n=1 Tax=Ascidiaceihabitans sp. TaxID=1872644 RepID=UPI003299BC8B